MLFLKNDINVFDIIKIDPFARKMKVKTSVCGGEEKASKQEAKRKAHVKKSGWGLDHFSFYSKLTFFPFLSFDTAYSSF